MFSSTTPVFLLLSIATSAFAQQAPTSFTTAGVTDLTIDEFVVGGSTFGAVEYATAAVTGAVLADDFYFANMGTQPANALATLNDNFFTSGVFDPPTASIFQYTLATEIAFTDDNNKRIFLTEVGAIGFGFGGLTVTARDAMGGQIGSPVVTIGGDGAPDHLDMGGFLVDRFFNNMFSDTNTRRIGLITWQYSDFSAVDNGNIASIEVTTNPMAQEQFLDVGDLGVATFIPSATGDPHLVGAHGQKFDFNGEPGALYSLISTPHFAVNMKLANAGPKARFITDLGVVFRNISLQFDTMAYSPAHKAKELRNKLVGTGAKVRVSKFAIVLGLCAGQEITIHQRKTFLWKSSNGAFYAQKPEGVSTQRQQFFNLDIDVELPGCHDDYDGVLGQTFQCKYATEKFSFDESTEENYRVASINSVSRTFSQKSACGNSVSKTLKGRSNSV